MDENVLKVSPDIAVKRLSKYSDLAENYKEIKLKRLYNEMLLAQKRRRTETIDTVESKIKSKNYDKIARTDAVVLLSEGMTEFMNDNPLIDRWGMPPSTEDIINLTITLEQAKLNESTKKLINHNVAAAFSKKSIGKERSKKANEEIDEIIELHDPEIVSQAIRNLLQRHSDGNALHVLDKFSHDRSILHPSNATRALTLGMMGLIPIPTVVSLLWPDLGREAVNFFISAFGLVAITSIVMYLISSGIDVVRNIKNNKKHNELKDEAFEVVFDQIKAEVEKLEAQRDGKVESERE